MSIPSAQILFSITILEKCLILGLRQEINKMSLEYFVLPESKELLAPPPLHQSQKNVKKTQEATGRIPKGGKFEQQNK